MALDFGWWNNFIGWMQPSGNGDRVIMIYGDYQEMRTNEETPSSPWPFTRPGDIASSPAAGATLLSPRACSPISRCSELKSRALRAGWRRPGTGQALAQGGASDQGASPGLSFSRQCPKRLFQEMQGYKEHGPGTGPHHSLDAPRYFFIGWAGA